MIKKRYYPFLFSKEIGFYQKLDAVAPYFIIAFIILTVFVTQNKKVGFEKAHHGWVTSHTLAIISKANADNYFVGYTLKFKDEQNKIEYFYFDRYPVFFSALSNVLLSFFNNLPAKVYVARQVMNFIFLGTLIVAFLLVDKVINNKLVALSAVLVAFSSNLLLYYKDMIHYDQPALFGFLLLLYAIAVYKLDGKRKLLYMAVLIAVSLGRGYASYAILGLWVILEFFTLTKSSDLKLSQRLKSFVRHDALVALIVGLMWGSSLLVINTYIEAKVRDVPISETSIVASALYRLNIDHSKWVTEADYQRTIYKEAWGFFTKGQLSRIISLSVPLGNNPINDDWYSPLGHRWLNSTNLRYLILLPIVLISGIFIKKQEANKRLILLLMALSGFFWLFPMRTLAAHHDYTAMFYIGIPLVFYTALFLPIKPKKYAIILLIFAVAVFITSNFLVNRFHSHLAENVDGYTHDFDRIAHMVEDEKNVYVDGGHLDLIPGAPNAVGFYLPDNYLTTSIKAANYVISSNKNYQASTLTPFNEKVFLFEP